MDILTEKHFEHPAENAPKAKIVRFVNFSKEPFTHTWNNIPYTFQPGEENAKYMESGIAYHFAKHLVNRELLKRGMENDTSPRTRSDNPVFMEYWNRCVTDVSLGDGPMDATKMEQEIIDRNAKAALAQSNEQAKPPSVSQERRIASQTQKEDHKADEEFEEIKGDSEADDLPPDQPSNMAATAGKPATKTSKPKAK